MDVLFEYTGKGVIPQGYQDPLNFVESVHRIMRRKKEKYMSLSTFNQAVTDGDSSLRNAKNSKKKIKDMYDMLTAYASDPKKGLSRKELRRAPLRIWSKPAVEGDSEGPLPCDHGQEYF